MKTTLGKLQISDRIGSISTILIEPVNPRFMMVLAHGAGAGMTHHFMENLAVELGGLGIITLRFNFPFSEGKKSRPDPAPVAEYVIGAVVGHAEQNYPGTPLFAAGKSFGGRMSSHWVSKSSGSGVSGLVFYGFPLHAVGKPGISRADHLNEIRKPMLFLQGTRDALAEISLIQSVCAKLPTATLKTFEGADHSFKTGKKDSIKELALATNEWMEGL